MEANIILDIIIIILAVIALAGLWKTFEKAGEKGWKGIIPVYNCYVMLRLTKHSGWWIAVFIAPVLLLILVRIIYGGEIPNSTTENPDAFLSTIGILVLLLVLAIMIIQTVVTYEMARSFKKRLSFTFGLIFLPFVFWPLLGFGDARYVGLSDSDCTCSGEGCTCGDKQEASTDKADEEEEKDSAEAFSDFDSGTDEGEGESEDDESNNNEDNKKNEAEHTNGDSQKDSDQG
ncbi:MAG: DUF5684 domain-containing protein [Candidatus Paceibacterota bacterium]